MSVDVKARVCVHILRRVIDNDHVLLACGRIATKDEPARRSGWCQDCLAADRFARGG